MLENKIEELLLEKFKNPEFQDCFLIELTIVPKKNVEIILDADEGLEIDKCRRISRHVENWLDTEGSMGEEYNIEVSSPGVARPLVYPRQYPKHVGRFLEVENTDGDKIEGVLTEVDADKIVLQSETIRKEGKKKITETIVSVFPYDKIKNATVQIRF
jgi:ribosome maturation factor RimP